MTSNRGRETAKAAGWLVAGAIGATALTGVAFAATQDPTPSPNTSAPSTSAPGDGSPSGDGSQQGPGGMMGGPGGRPDGDGDGMRGPGGPGMRGPGMRGPGGPGGDRILHGDVTVKDENDKAVQARIQTGTIESVSATSITVKSEDGYTSTWTLNSDTKVHRDRSDATVTDLKQGDFVNVRGPLSGDSATAKNVGALSPAAKAELDKVKAERDTQRQSDSDSGSSSGSSTQGSNSSSSASFDTNI